MSPPGGERAPREGNEPGRVTAGLGWAGKPGRSLRSVCAMLRMEPVYEDSGEAVAPSAPSSCHVYPDSGSPMGRTTHNDSLNSLNRDPPMPPTSVLPHHWCCLFRGRVPGLSWGRPPSSPAGPVQVWGRSRPGASPGLGVLRRVCWVPPAPPLFSTQVPAQECRQRAGVRGRSAVGRALFPY